LLRAADAKDLSQRLRTAGARKVALMLDPEAKPLTSSKSAAFEAVVRGDARERKSQAEATDGVRHEGLVMGATLQAKAKMGVGEFAARGGGGAAGGLDAVGGAGAGAALVPEAGSYYARQPAPQQQAPMGAKARLRSGGFRQAAQDSAMAPSSSGEGVGGGDAGQQQAPVPSAIVPVDAFGKAAKATTATRAIFGFNNLAQGVPGFLSRTLAGRTVTTAV